jgi:hypothetical protein
MFDRRANWLIALLIVLPDEARLIRNLKIAQQPLRIVMLAHSVRRRLCIPLTSNYSNE